MTIDELQDAMSLRHASDKIRAPLRMRKGKFGMGLKVAALRLGETFSIETRSIKTPGTTLEFPFDSRSFAKQDEWTGLPVYENDESEASSPLGDRSHGTAIIISDLFGRLSEDDALDARELLCTIFHHALGDPINSVITFNGAPLVPTRPKMNKDVEILKLDDFDLWVKEDLGGGRRGEPIQIRGWVGLTEITKSGDLKYGFHTFRRNQLIEQFHNAGFGADPPGLWPYRTPHSELARLFGHIHLDMVPPNFHKKGWNTKSDAWSEVVDALKDVLEKIVLLARKTTKDVKKSKDLLGAWTRFA